MANPPHLFRVDGRLEQLVLHTHACSDDVVGKLGFDPRSSSGFAGVARMYGGLGS